MPALMIYYKQSFVKHKEKTMIYVSEIQSAAPTVFKNELQNKAYSALSALGIPFERVDTDEVITMDDCVAINEKLNMKMVKTLFLCNKQHTEFYLFITAGNKPFRSKDFSVAMNAPHLSFAPVELMETMLGTKIGAATVLSVLLPSAANVKVVIEKDVLAEEYYGCSDGTTTGYLKIKTDDVIHKVLAFAKHGYSTVKI